MGLSPLLLLLPLTVMAKTVGKGVGVHDQLSHTNAAEPQHWVRHRRIEPPHLRTKKTDEEISGCEMLRNRRGESGRKGVWGGDTDFFDPSTSTSTIEQQHDILIKLLLTSQTLSPTT